MSDSPPADNPIDSEMKKLKIHSESKPVEFSDLPTDALILIIDQLELKERLILRKVSHGLRALVDVQKSILTEIAVECHFDHIRANFNSNTVVYAEPEFEDSNFKNHYRYKDAKVIRSEDCDELAHNDVEFAIKDPQLQLDVLRVYFFSYQILRKKFTEELETILKSLNHKISTKTYEARVESADHILAVLPYLKPATLQCIELRQNDASWRISDAEFDKIAELDQWKQAKQLNLRYARSMWPWKHLMHFQEFSFHDEGFPGARKIREWTDLFSKSKHFIKCQLVTTYGFYLHVQNYISDGVPILISGEEFVNPIYLIEHPIRDDPNQYLEIKVWPKGKRITIKKMTRQSP